MRFATEKDLEFLAGCFIERDHLNAGESDPYIQGLPAEVDASSRTAAAHFLGNDQALALIYEVDEQPVACLLGEITSSSFPPAGLGRVGHIAVSWVAPEYRKTAVARKLVATAEKWFREHGVDLVEVSYLVKNKTAARAWKRLGYEPFRGFSYKQL